MSQHYDEFDRLGIAWTLAGLVLVAGVLVGIAIYKTRRSNRGIRRSYRAALRHRLPAPSPSCQRSYRLAEPN